VYVCENQQPSTVGTTSPSKVRVTGDPPLIVLRSGAAEDITIGSWRLIMTWFSDRMPSTIRATEIAPALSAEGKIHSEAVLEIGEARSMLSLLPKRQLTVVPDLIGE
jgi:hypothetical protein